MKKLLLISAFVASSAMQTALASNVGVGVDIHIGNQPPLMPVPVPAPLPPPVVIEEPPLFLYPPELGFGVAVGLPYDMFFISGSYYLKRGDAWYRGSHYNGPWATTRYRSLPPGLRSRRFEQIHYYRDREYRAYQARHEGYHGRHFRPEKEWRKEGHEQRKEGKKLVKDERGHDNGHGRHGYQD
jgi:hypothetical protein